MNALFLNAKPVRINNQQAIGKGTEADVYLLDNCTALKVFKGADHPDLAGDDQAIAAAEARLKEHQTKLPAFPRNLSNRVVAPVELARTRKAGGEVVGYSMPLITDAERLKVYWPERTEATQLLLDLHGTVTALHRAGIVIGDFTPLNILARGQEAYIIDADSFQFGPFLSRMFTESYVDPVLCDPKARRPILTRPHCESGDWFAYSVIAMETLLRITPYHGGVFKGKGVPHCARPLKRITVFNKEVVYPKQALHYRVLPDPLIEYFVAVFERDDRAVFPRELLERLRWRTCACGTSHARPVCPICSLNHGPVPTPPTVCTRGSLRAEIIFRTAHRLAGVEVYDERLLFGYCDGRQTVVCDAGRERRWNAKCTAVHFLHGAPVLLNPGEARFEDHREPVDNYQGKPQFVATAEHAHWLSNGYLWRNAGNSRTQVTQVLRNQTALWAGRDLGAVFYRAGALSGGYLFGTNNRTLIQLPDLGLGNAEILCMRVVFSGKNGAWVLLHLKERASIFKRLLLVDAGGKEKYRLEDEAIDESYQGACAGPNALFIPTDDGIARLSLEDYSTQIFSQTADFITTSTQLLLFRHGIYAITPQTITELRLG